MRLLLSEREKNAQTTCSRCANRMEHGFCRYPILMEYNHGTVRISRLISFSEDGLTCQLFREAINKEDETDMQRKLRLMNENAQYGKVGE